MLSIKNKEGGVFTEQTKSVNKHNKSYFSTVHKILILVEHF